MFDLENLNGSATQEPGVVEAGGFCIDMDEGRRLYKAYLDEHGIPIGVADLVCQLLRPSKTAELTGYRVWSLKIHYWNPDGTADADFARVRFLQVRKKDEPADGRPDFRYWQPGDSGSRLYQPVPVLAWLGGDHKWVDWQADKKKLLTLVEGEFESIRLMIEGVFTAAVAGVWNHGDRKHAQYLLKEFGQFEVRGRDIEVNFDNDIFQNASSLAALDCFAKAFSNRGANVYFWKPPSGKAKGPGDYITAFGLQAYQALLRIPYGLAEQLKPYNERHAVIETPPCIMKEANSTFTLYKVSDLKDVWEKPNKAPVRQRSGKFKDCFLIDEWSEWGGRRTFSGIDYLPGRPKLLPDGKYNAWQGWGCESIPGDVTLFQTLLKQLVPDDEELRRAVLQDLAAPIAMPGTKLHRALVIKGVPGAGKSLLGKIMRAIYGKPNVSKIGNRELGATFNGWMSYKQFIVGEEVKGNSNIRHDSEGLKEWITGDEVLVNEKFIPAHPVRNVANFLLLSNDRLPLYVARNDRRYIIIDVRKEVGEELGARIHNWAMGGGITHIRHYLEHEVGFTGWSATSNAPLSAAKRAVQDAGGSGLERFARELMGDDERPAFATYREIYAAAEREISISEGKYVQLTNALEEAGAMNIRQRFRINPVKREMKDKIWRLKGSNEELSDDALRAALVECHGQRIAFFGDIGAIKY